MKKTYLFAAIALIGMVSLLTLKNHKPSSLAQESQTKDSVSVEALPAWEFSTLTEKITLPATVVGDQEVSITAKTGGIITDLPVNLGNFVGTGALIARIDDQAGNLSAADNGFVSSQLQQSNLAIEQAKENLNAAKKAYDNLKKDSAATKAQLSAAKAAREIAEIQLENARVLYNGSLDNHLIKAPISGFVISKPLSAGNAVSAGQTILTLSKTKAVKIQFYVSAEHLAFIQKGMSIELSDEQGQTSSAIVRNISPVADPTTKRFLIEAYPDAKNTQALLSGTIVSASFSLTEKPQNESALLFPLSAITVGQNESFIFQVKDSIAKKVGVKVLRVDGEYAEIQGDFASDAKLVTKGQSFLQDGLPVTINN